MAKSKIRGIISTNIDASYHQLEGNIKDVIKFLEDLQQRYPRGDNYINIDDSYDELDISFTNVHEESDEEYNQRKLQERQIARQLRAEQKKTKLNQTEQRRALYETLKAEFEQ